MVSPPYTHYAYMFNDGKPYATRLIAIEEGHTPEFRRNLIHDLIETGELLKKLPYPGITSIPELRAILDRE